MPLRGEELRVCGQISTAKDPLEGVPRERYPDHIALIMDGNGRWAQGRGKRRHHGHREGAKTVKRLVIEGARLRLKQMTLYSFSSENWNRPRLEVSLLMRLYRRRILTERELMMDTNIRFRVIGDVDGLPNAVAKQMRIAEEQTSGNSGLVLCLALNYGARGEMLRAVRGIARDTKAGRLDPEKIDEQLISDRLDTSGMSDPDLLVRTAGERRLSNFLLWQLSYTELYFTDVLWPDFTVRDLHEAIREYATRQRRFCGLPSDEKQGGR